MALPVVLGFRSDGEAQHTVSVCRTDVPGVRTRRLEIAKERWRRCERQAALYDGFACWRATARRGAAVRDAGICLLRGRLRCMLIQSWAGWQAFTRCRWRCELHGLLVGCLRRGTVLRTWLMAALDASTVRRGRLRRAFRGWVRRSRWSGQVLARSATADWARAATRLSSSFLYWRSECLRQRVIASAAWAAVPEVLSSWLDFIRDQKEEFAAREAILARRRRKGNLVRWHFLSGRSRSWKSRLSDVLRRRLFQGFAWWHAAVEIMHSRNAELVGQADLKLLARIQSWALQAWLQVVSRSRKARHCSGAVVARRRSEVLMEWAKVTQASFTQGSQQLRLRDQAFLAWRAHSVCRRSWKRRTSQ
ncbi:unnamed protein product, partial [Polarella glacialis]